MGARSGADAPTAAELAYHWDAAHDWPRALQATVEAGFVAEHAYAFAEAYRHDERALELWDRVADADALILGDRATLLQRTAEMASLIGFHRRAVELGRAAVAAIPQGTDDARRALFLERLRWFLWEAGDRQAAEDALGEAAGLSADGPATAARARLHAHRAALDMAAGRFVVSRDGAETALEEARAANAHVEEALALGVLGWDVAMLGDIDAGIAHLDVGADDRRRRRQRRGRGARLDDPRRARGTRRPPGAGRALRAGRRGGCERSWACCARTAAASGRPRRPRSSPSAAGTRPSGRGGRPRRATDAAGRRSRCSSRRPGSTPAGAGSPRPPGGSTPPGRPTTALRGTDDRPRDPARRSAELGAWRGSVADVRAAADEGVRIADRYPSDPAVAGLLAFAIRAEADVAARARARRDEAAAAEAAPRRRGAGRDARGLGGRSGARPLPGSRRGSRSRRRSAAAELARCKGEAGPDAWRAIVRVARTRPGVRSRRRTRGTAKRRRAWRPAARGPTWPTALRAAHGRSPSGWGRSPLAAEVATLARLARIELEVAGPGPETHPTLAGLGLTDREAEVLRLVAGGWTNQQIADALFIARKTASVHVSNILGKLGVDSRVEAAAIAHRLGFGAGRADARRTPPDRSDRPRDGRSARMRGVP